MSKIYVCTACGKRSKDKLGYDAIDNGWDESCCMHSELVDEKIANIIHDNFKEAMGLVAFRKKLCQC